MTAETENLRTAWRVLGRGRGPGPAQPADRKPVARLPRRGPLPGDRGHHDRAARPPRDDPVEPGAVAPGGQAPDELCPGADDDQGLHGRGRGRVRRRAASCFEGQRTRPEIYPVLRDLARFYIGGAEIAKAAAVGREILQLGESQDDPADAPGWVSHPRDRHDVRGRSQQRPRASWTRAWRIRGPRLSPAPPPDGHGSAGVLPRRLGVHPVDDRVSPDRAVERSNRGVALAREADPYSLSYGLFHSGFLHLWRRNRSRSRSGRPADRDGDRSRLPDLAGGRHGARRCGQ